MDEVVEEAIEKYQGLVPLVYDIETMGLAEARPQDMQYAVYLKREADKVIAELKKACNSKDDWCLHTLKENRHHKYKRCLAMAKICEDKLGTVVKPGWWNKWRKRWLELAEEPTWARFLQLIHKEVK